MTEALRTDHGQRPEEKAGKVDFGQTGAPTGTLIKTASPALSTPPVGGRRLGEESFRAMEIIERGGIHGHYELDPELQAFLKEEKLLD